MHTIRVAHSPDSDDAFMYYGLACGAVRPEGIRFEQALSDIESANAAAQEGRFDLTAISAAAYPSLAARYLLLDSGVRVTKAGSVIGASPMSHTPIF